MSDLETETGTAVILMDEDLTNISDSDKVTNFKLQNGRKKAMATNINDCLSQIETKNRGGPIIDLKTARLSLVSVSEICGTTPPPETTAPIKPSSTKKIKSKTPSEKINAKRKNEIQEIF